MDDIVKIEIPKPEIPIDWDYNSENKKFDELIYGWRRFTIDVISYLWIFYNKLKVQGERRDIVEISTMLPTWSEWLESKGISRKTPLKYFRKFKWIKIKIKELNTPPLPEGIFNVIYADPAWPVESIIMDKWESPIDDKYPTMSIEEIKNLAIEKISADDCSLFIWTTHAFLPDCLDIIEIWGFKYHCIITWNKGSGWTQFGFHKMTEFLLYAYKGKMNINQYGKAIPTLITENKTYHSKKPDSIRDLIKSKTPEGRLELFARNEYDGWKAWGNEIKIITDDERR